MKKLFLLIIPVMLLSACSSGIMNLSKAKKDVINYYESGQYDKEMDEIINDAIKKFENIQFDKNSAVVFDVDETSLANYPHIKAMGFGSVDSLWDKWTLSGMAKAIPQTKKLYDLLVSKWAKIIFITGRDIKYCEATKKNLIKEGFTKIDTLICRDYKISYKNAAEYKTYHRNELVKKGMKIIANVGDQLSDSEGGNSGIIIKLPNYIYILD